MDASPLSTDREGMKIWFRKQGITYSSHPQIHEASLEFLTRKRSILPSMYERELQRHHVSALRIVRINDTLGYGCFAAEDIAPLDFIGEYTGHVVPREQVLQEGAYAIYYNGTKTLAIDAARIGNETRFLNHTPKVESNVVPEHAVVSGIRRLYFFAKEFISSGTELRFDYGPEYFLHRHQSPDRFHFDGTQVRAL